MLRQRFLPSTLDENCYSHRNALRAGSAANTTSVASAPSVTSSVAAPSEHDVETGAGVSVSRTGSSAASRSSLLRRNADREENNSTAPQLVESFEYSSLLAAWLRLGESKEEAEV